jgi:hypothetical protein
VLPALLIQLDQPRERFAGLGAMPEPVERNGQFKERIRVGGILSDALPERIKLPLFVGRRGYDTVACLIFQRGAVALLLRWHRLMRSG